MCPCVLSNALPGEACTYDFCHLDQGHCAEDDPNGFLFPVDLFQVLQRSFSSGARFWAETGYLRPDSAFSSLLYNLVGPHHQLTHGKGLCILQVPACIIF